MAKAKRIILCGASAGPMLLLSGCASTSEPSSPQSLKAEEWIRAHEPVGDATSSCKLLPKLSDASGLSTDLRLALFKYQDAERKITLYRDALIPKADQSVKVIQHSFETGKSDFLSLIDAQRVLLEFELAYERAVADREQGLATVEKLVGGESPALAPAHERKP